MLLHFHQVLVLQVVRLKQFLTNEPLKNLHLSLQHLNVPVNLNVFIDQAMLNRIYAHRRIIFLDPSDLKQNPVHLLF